jgi:EAL domain-containing protein (putative c-di-GMP-specific phosphodiesterase class I)
MSEAKILIVDDTRANLIALQVLLKPVDANIVAANSGEQAIKIALEQVDHIALILLDDSSEVMTYIDEISNCGVRLSVDDFGTGFSALSYLKNYPVSTVKIDRSFIMDLPADKENAVLVQAIIAMAHGLGLGLEVIAEGVETIEQWEFLRALDCDFAQGYYFGKPMPENEFEDFLISQVGSSKQAQS